ncbi:hypothetical protein BABINDRAFT_80024 [Babjeviella inositovora NRRL Y-12698]|uniref:Uncharacterized protein n=1 Tax=Babjeviella inositovora NRRL Y-12698 TaxID=984486 RepID=A0A1E3QZC7_9ASCO|nr:uncharacterized protein BABINDRAFT_80024 [Babjeviella inositovora NRRL Y-12698]ODQ83039.1 hypothetical protein BABINDRAFT_80024 [Babjeviella inositovora NRRL Y-12698]
MAIKKVKSLVLVFSVKDQFARTLYDTCVSVAVLPCSLVSAREASRHGKPYSSFGIGEEFQVRFNPDTRRVTKNIEIAKSIKRQSFQNSI